MLFRLIVLTGNLKGQRITVGNDPITIGRDPACGICVSDAEVATQHAVLEHNELTGLQIKDLGSMNRVLVNNHEIREAHLKHGDIIELGRTRFLVQASVETDLTKKAPKLNRPRISLTPFLVVLPLLIVIYAVLSFGRKIMKENPVVVHVPVPAVATFVPGFSHRRRGW